MFPLFIVYLFVLLTTTYGRYSLNCANSTELTSFCEGQYSCKYTGHIHRIGQPHWPCNSDCRCVEDGTRPDSEIFEDAKSVTPLTEEQIEVFPPHDEAVAAVAIPGVLESQYTNGKDISISTPDHTTFSTSTITLYIARDIAAVAAAATQATITTAKIKPPQYNNYAMNCYDSKDKTVECQAEPYKYFCNSMGKLRRLGKKDELYCDYCDCVDLFPKSNCMVGLIGNTYCVRDLEYPQYGDDDGVLVGSLDDRRSKSTVHTSGADS